MYNVFIKIGPDDNAVIIVTMNVLLLFPLKRVITPVRRCIVLYFFVIVIHE